MPKIMLVTPPISSKAQYGYLEKGSNNIAPIGLLSVASYMRKIGEDVAVIDAEAHRYSFEETIDLILSANPKYIGTTAVSLSAPVAAYMAKLIHEKRPDIPVILGGVHISSMPEETLKRYSDINYGIIGEGEISFHELIKALDVKGDITKLDGIAYRNNGNIVINNRREEISNLDVLPMPAWDLLDAFPVLYTPPAHCFGRTPVAHIVAMRGCDYNCIFCSKKTFPNKGRFFSAEYVIDMLKYLIDKFGIKELKYYDDNIYKDKSRFRKLC
jgi:anaerobic magnesium-protoporphyrin IX monomethyl ester cyclase